MRPFLGWLDDRLNPIVVKEVRQAVRGRFLAGLLIFFLALQLATLGIFLLSKGISSIDLVGGESYGEQVFGILAGILFFATVFCIPVYAAVRIYSERSSDAMALFFVSTLSPRRIISGKLASNLVLVLLLFSACLPYLSFTYFLRGIDLPTVFVVLIIGLLASTAGIQGAVFLASLQVTRMLRVLIGLAGLGGLMMLFAMSLGMALALPELGVGSRLGSWTFWGPASGILLTGVLFFGLIFVLSVAIITHGAANRARPVRIYALAAWLVAAAAVGYAGIFQAQGEIVELWLRTTLLLLAGSFLPAVSARDRMSLRVAEEVPRSTLRRLAAFFLFSGSANGVAFSALMVASTVAVAAAFDARMGGVLAHLSWQLLGLCCYLFAYSLIGMRLQRRLLHRWIRREQTWVVVLVLIAAASLLPPIVAFLVAPDTISRSLDFGLSLILNPLAPFQFQLGAFATLFGAGLAVVAAVLAGGWFTAQVRAFRPPAGALITEPEAEA